MANAPALRAEGRSVVLYLPKIQVAAEAALWSRLLDALEAHLGLPAGTILVYVLVEQVEAAFQLMEIRAALGRHFVGFNTGRWDYINSVADALHGDPAFANPNIDAITMTYAYMRAYEDRVRRAVNTPDASGRFALWQGGMEAQIPVGSEAGVEAAMAKAVAGAEREQREGASGKWVAHWKMVHIVRPVWERVGEANQLGRSFPALTHTAEDAAALVSLEAAPRTVRGARDLLSVGLQYGNAFLRGFQAAALKPADFFGDDDVLYLMEDMATGEIRLSILWEWLHKGAPFTADDPATGSGPARRSPPPCSRGCSTRSTRSCSPPTAATSTTTPRGRRSRSPGRSSRPTCPPRPSPAGTSTCSTSTSATRTRPPRGSGSVPTSTRSPATAPGSPPTPTSSPRTLGRAPSGPGGSVRWGPGARAMRHKPPVRGSGLYSGSSGSS